MTWGEATRRKLARRALERQLAYQERKAAHVRGREDEIILAMKTSSRRVRDLLETFQPIKAEARVVEVGSGAHGLIFYFGSRCGIGVDPLAVNYGSLFPRWQRCAPTVAAVGESLPFRDQSFDVVLCDNVVDHAESPVQIAGELARVLVHSQYSSSGVCGCGWRAFNLAGSRFAVRSRTVCGSHHASFA